MVKVEASTDADYPARSRLYRDGRVAPRHGVALRHGLAVRHGVALRHGLALSGSV